MSSHEEQYNVSSHTHPGFLSKFTQSISVLGKVAVSENQQDIILLSHSRKGPIFDYTICFTLVQHEGITSRVLFDVYHKLKQLTIPFIPSKFKTHTMKDFTQLEAIINHMKQFQNVNEDTYTPKETFLYRQR